MVKLQALLVVLSIALTLYTFIDCAQKDEVLSCADFLNGVGCL